MRIYNIESSECCEVNEAEYENAERLGKVIVGSAQLAECVEYTSVQDKTALKKKKTSLQKFVKV